jgi:hypothetical protein
VFALVFLYPGRGKSILTSGLDATYVSQWWLSKLNVQEVIFQKESVCVDFRLSGLLAHKDV